MTRTATPAQTLRLTRIRKDIKGTGYRITTRQLPAGLIEITEHLGRTKAAVSVLGTDGNYIDQAAPAKATKLAAKATKPRRSLPGQGINDRVAAVLFNRLPEDLQARFLADLSPEDRATLEAGLRACAAR